MASQFQFQAQPARTEIDLHNVDAVIEYIWSDPEEQELTHDLLCHVPEGEQRFHKWFRRLTEEILPWTNGRKEIKRYADEGFPYYEEGPRGRYPRYRPEGGGRIIYGAMQKHEILEWMRRARDGFLHLLPFERMTRDIWEHQVHPEEQRHLLGIHLPFPWLSISRITWTRNGQLLVLVTPDILQKRVNDWTESIERERNKENIWEQEKVKLIDIYHHVPEIHVYIQRFDYNDIKTLTKNIGKLHRHVGEKYEEAQEKRQMRAVFEEVKEEDPQVQQWIRVNIGTHAFQSLQPFVLPINLDHILLGRPLARLRTFIKEEDNVEIRLNCWLIKAMQAIIVQWLASGDGDNHVQEITDLDNLIVHYRDNVLRFINHAQAAFRNPFARGRLEDPSLPGRWHIDLSRWLNFPSDNYKVFKQVVAEGEGFRVIESSFNIIYEFADRGPLP
jgi:hypothetical protein